MDLKVETEDKDSVIYGAKKLKALTYNLHHGVDSKSRDTLKYIKDYLNNSGADFLFLQEIDYANKRSNFLDQGDYLSSSLYPYVMESRHHNYKEGHYGNILLSKFPINKTAIISLPHNYSGHIVDALEVTHKPEARFITKCKVNVEGEELSLLNLHLPLAEPDREKSLALLIKEFKNNDKIIMAGDFNIKELKELSEFDNFNLNKTYPTYPVDEPIYFLDQILCSGVNVLSMESPKIDFSDHYPLLLEFSIE